MALANTADRGIAAHLAEIFGAESEQGDVRAATRGGISRLAPRMTSANDKYVEHPAPIQMTGAALNVSRETLRADRSRNREVSARWQTRWSVGPGPSANQLEAAKC